MNKMLKLDTVIGELEKKINYKFQHREYLMLALTHSSYANEIKSGRFSSNERLEFLGDAVLNIVISERLYQENAELSEGELTKARASIVCEASLMKCSNDIGLGEYLLLGKGEELTGGRSRSSILCDLFEALIGAIYLDGGMERVKSFILFRMNNLIKEAINGTVSVDYKTSLQELVQRNGEQKVLYEVIEEKGPDHCKIFVSQIRIGQQVMGTGEGKSKKEAEQHAAKKVLELLR